MPETTMNKNNGFVHRKNEIRLAGKSLIMNAVSKAVCVESAPKEQFGLRVLASDTRHHARARLLVYNIHQLHSSFAFGRVRIGAGL